MIWLLVQTLHELIHIKFDDIKQADVTWFLEAGDDIVLRDVPVGAVPCSRACWRSPASPSPDGCCIHRRLLPLPSRPCARRVLPRRGVSERSCTRGARCYGLARSTDRLQFLGAVLIVYIYIYIYRFIYIYKCPQFVIRQEIRGFVFRF